VNVTVTSATTKAGDAMYFVGRNDRQFRIPVWGRFGNTRNRVVIANIYRHTKAEAEAYVVGLGYEIVVL
jgi:hypothetical protein